MGRKRNRAAFTFRGRRYFVDGVTKEDAKVKAEMRKKEMEEGRLIHESALTISEWAYEAVSLYKTNQKEVTRERYLGVLQSSVLNEIGHIPLRNATPKDLQDCLNQQAGRSTDHIRRVDRMLAFIFDTAVDNKLIQESPAKGLVKPKGTIGGNRMITEKERDAIVEVCKDDKYILFLFMLDCGCRPSEALGIEHSDLQVIDGRNLLHIRGTKTKASDRYVPVPEYLWERAKKNSPTPVGQKRTKGQYNKLVNRWRDALREEMGGEYINVPAGEYNGKKHYKKEWVNDPLEKDFRPYCLRHTYCTDLRDKGVDMRDAQYLMGHSTIAMTANIYTHSDIATALRISHIL